MCQYDSGTNGACPKLHSVFLKAVGERDISAYETSRLFMSGRFSSSTFSYKRRNVDPDQQSHLRRLGQGSQGSEVGGQPKSALGMTASDRYATRAASTDNHPGIMSMGVFEFTRCFKVSRGGPPAGGKPRCYRRD